MQVAKLLIIDDNPSDIRILIEILRNQNFCINIALNGNDGFDKAVSLDPDLILLDRLMPNMDGSSVCRLLKSDSRTSNIPIIFLTAMQSVEDKVAGFALGACDYITKPWNEAEVIARLRVHLELHKHLKNKNSVKSTTKQNKETEFPLKEEGRVALRVHYAQKVYLENLQENLSLSEVAQRVGTYARQLADDFRTVTGQSTQTWLREKRMQQACHYLLNTEKEISSIAEEVGYTSAAAFSNAFREHFGLTPREYRRTAGLPPLQ